MRQRTWFAVNYSCQSAVLVIDCETSYDFLKFGVSAFCKPPPPGEILGNSVQSLAV